MQPALRALIERYCLTLDGQMHELEGFFSDFSGTAGAGPVDVSDALDLVHRITGIAGSMGYPAVSDAAAALERTLRIVDKADGIADAETTGNVMTLFSSLRLAAGMATPEASALNKADLGWLDAPARAAKERA